MTVVSDGLRPMRKLAAFVRSGSIVASFGRFGLVGVLTTAFNYVLFLGLMAVGFPYFPALLIAWIPSVGLGFLLNRRVTFLVAGRLALREALSYAAATAFQLVLALAGFVVLIDGLGVAPALAYPINLVGVAGSNFLLLRFWVYAQRRGAAAAA